MIRCSNDKALCALGDGGGPLGGAPFIAVLRPLRPVPVYLAAVRPSTPHAPDPGVKLDAITFGLSLVPSSRLVNGTTQGVLREDKFASNR